MSEEHWFSVDIELGPVGNRPEDVHTIREVARRTGRSYSAVKAARQEGRIPPAPPPPGLRGDEANAAWVRATQEQLAAWRVKSTEEVLAEHPSLPQDPSRWMTVDEIARRLELPRSAVVSRIRSRDPRELRWDDEVPWQTQVRYWLPDLR